MTIEQAMSTMIEILPRIGKDYDAVDMAIDALEKQIPKKPSKPFPILCPVCKDNLDVLSTIQVQYCPQCGQALDWSDCNA